MASEVGEQIRLSRKARRKEGTLKPRAKWPAYRGDLNSFSKTLIQRLLGLHARELNTGSSSLKEF